jgi:hypothetical protein
MPAQDLNEIEQALRAGHEAAGTGQLAVYSILLPESGSSRNSVSVSVRRCYW